MKKFNSVTEELKYIASKNNGILNPHEVVKFAENPKTHLHSRMEWEDSKAAHAYRVWQARKIIKLELQVVEVDNKEEKVTTYFVSLKDDRKPGGGYRETINVLQTPSLRDQLINEALNELIRIRDKYSQLVYFAEVFDKIDMLEKERKEKKAG